MKQNYFKFLIIILVIAFIVPQITFASWWNPFSWGWLNKIFHFQQQIQENQKQTGLTLNVIKNGKYEFGGKTMQFSDGKYIENYSYGKVTTGLYGVTIGDLNGDGINDAVSYLGTESGGTGFFINLVAIIDKDGTPHLVASKDLGDRTVINSININSGIISVDMTVHGPNDPMCCPTQRETIEYKLVNGKLVEQTANQTANWKTYTNTEYGFEFKYPASTDWNKYDEVKRGLGYRENDFTSIRFGNYMEIEFGKFVDATGKVIDINELTNNKKYIKTILIDGRTAIDHYYSQDGRFIYIPLKNEDVLIIRGPSKISAVPGVFTDKPELEKIFEQIISSFKFITSSSQNEKPSITVTSPNGGEAWTPRNVPIINWTYNGIDDNSMIFIYIINYDNNKICPLMEGNLPILGKELVLANINGDIYDYLSCTSTGSKMKLKITFKGNKTTIPNYDISDESDNYFTIIK